MGDKNFKNHGTNYQLGDTNWFRYVKIKLTRLASDCIKVFKTRCNVVFCSVPVNGNDITKVFANQAFNRKIFRLQFKNM